MSKNRFSKKIWSVVVVSVLISSFSWAGSQEDGKMRAGPKELIRTVSSSYLITQMGKEPIIAVIERRGEVIYYKINKMNFYENKSRLEESFKI